MFVTLMNGAVVVLCEVLQWSYNAGIKMNRGLLANRVESDNWVAVSKFSG